MSRGPWGPNHPFFQAWGTALHGPEAPTGGGQLLGAQQTETWGIFVASDSPAAKVPGARASRYAAKTERKGLGTIKPVDLEQIMLALRNTPGALDALAKEIFKQSGSPPTGNSDDGGINDNSMFFGSPH